MLNLVNRMRIISIDLLSASVICKKTLVGREKKKECAGECFKISFLEISSELMAFAYFC